MSPLATAAPERPSEGFAAQLAELGDLIVAELPPTDEVSMLELAPGAPRRFPVRVRSTLLGKQCGAALNSAFADTVKIPRWRLVA